jgi:hypothetical protein
MTHTEKKLGESLIRTLIAELDARVTKLEADAAACRIGPRTFRARRRYVTQDFKKLERLARRYGFRV